MSWSRIYLALREEGLWLKEKETELIQEGNNEWRLMQPQGATCNKGQ